MAGSAPVKIGLLGGVCSGKSTVASIFADLGAQVIDADRLAREVMELPSVRKRIRKEWPETADLEGEPLRRELARQVFDDRGERKKLEKILHPEIRKRILNRLSSPPDGCRVQVLDVPLLMEGGLVEKCDAAVFVSASRKEREKRAAKKGWNPAEVRRREEHQVSLEEKRKASDWEIENDRTLQWTKRQASAVLNWIGNGSI